MAIVRMQRIRVCGLRRQRKRILELLQRCGVVEIDEPDREEEGFERADVSAQRSSLERELKLAQEAIQLLQEAVPEKKGLLASLEGRRALSEQELEDFRAQSTKTAALAKRVLAAAREREEVRTALTRLDTEEEALVPWAALDVPLRAKGTNSSWVFIGTLPGA